MEAASDLIEDHVGIPIPTTHALSPAMSSQQECLGHFLRLLSVLTNLLRMPGIQFSLDTAVDGF
jgi:hypothetical protein